ncbi:MAG: hypothetical protein J6O49_19705 [Bacteroidaceae bacterium]|nr:hypothetical protein [Bacteroidaceae bacterium]
MNEETIIEKRPVINGQEENKNEGGSWKHVTLGGVSGILMGAGLLYAGQAVAATNTDAPEETADAATADTQQAEGGNESTLSVAQMHNDMSFGEAFAAARAEVGPGGVFIWHGGIYNTYTADEWNAMTPQQKNDFAHQVNPEVRAHEVPTPTDAHPDVAAHPTTEAEVHPASDTGDVHLVEQQIAQNFDMGDDVHIVGYANAEGHLVVGYDSTGDGQADVAIIDVDNDLRPSDADVIMDREGNMATLGELNNEQTDPNQMTAMENPDVAPDMPDYMNDANIDDMNVLA